jgi:hypothetical protein
MRRLIGRTCGVVILLACCIPAGSASGQSLTAATAPVASVPESETVTRIRDGIVALRSQIDALPQDARTRPEAIADLQRQLEGLETQLAAFGERAGSPSQAPAPAPAEAQTPLQKDLGQDIQTDDDTVRGDQFSVPRIDNRPIDRTRANFIDLPGTEAGFQIGGYAKLDLLFDPRLAGNIDKFVSSTIPVDVPSEGQYGNFNIHARQTRFQLNFIKGTQKSVGGPLRFFLEADFFGGDGQLAFRMRHAYGSKANVVGGFTWSAFTDPDAFPDTLDFEMVPGTTQNRQPQLRYTKPFGEDRNTSLAFSVEKPTVDVSLVENTDVVTRYPDIIVRFRDNWEGGHVQAGVALRSLGASNRTTTTDTAFGIVGSVTFADAVFGSDLVTAGVVGGRGAAHYISTISGLGLDAAINVAAREIEPVNSIGAHVGYKHNWTDKLRSTVTYGFNDVEDNEFLPLSSVHSNQVAEINLIFKFAPAATAGVEYIWGDNELLNGEDGWAQRIQVALKYDLTK